jgi:hypothetical protein
MPNFSMEMPWQITAIAKLSWQFHGKKLPWNIHGKHLPWQLHKSLP